MKHWSRVLRTKTYLQEAQQISVQSFSFLLMESAMWGQQKGILNRHNKCGDLGFKAQTMESGQELKEGIRMNLPTTNSGDSNEIFPPPTTPGRFEYS
jgi:hypothetical protein